MAPTRWGIASTGLVAADFTNALSLLPSEDHKVLAVGARALDSAEKFAKQFNIPKAYGSYKELADDPDIDVVYVATIHPVHFGLCKLLIEAGKNILCEKPMTMNANQAKIILDMAKKRNVFFMEGIWSRFFPVYYKLREALASSVIGDVKVVNVCLGKNVIHRNRFADKQMGGAATLDLGCYPVQFAQHVFGEYPERIVTSGIQSETGIDEASFTTLHYSKGRVAQICAHASATLLNKAEIYGTKGTIEIPYFWCPVSITIAGEKHEFPLPTAAHPMNYPHGEAFTFEAEAVRQCLLKGEKEHPLMSHQDSLWNMSILSEILTQNGVVFEV